MRNQKLLWGMIGSLLTAGLFLVAFLAKDLLDHSNEPSPSPYPSAGKSAVVAKVGDHEITLQVLYEHLYRRYGPELLRELMERNAIRQEADALGIRLTREEVDQELLRIQQGYDSEEIFYKTMQEQLGLSKEEIREDVYYRMLLERIATWGIEVTEEEVEEYIRNHPEEYEHYQQYKLQIIVNKTKEQAEKTIELYRAGRDFSSLAIERSIDDLTASEGGDMGWVEGGDPFVPPEILEAAKNLDIGSISQPIETADGYAVIKLLDRKDMTDSERKAVQDSVRKRLLLQKAPSMKDVLDSLLKKYNARVLEPSLSE